MFSVFYACEKRLVKANINTVIFFIFSELMLKKINDILQIDISKLTIIAVAINLLSVHILNITIN